MVLEGDSLIVVQDILASLQIGALMDKLWQILG